MCPTDPNAVDAEVTALVASMKTPTTHAAFDAVFAMTPKQLGQAALDETKRDSSDLNTPVPFFHTGFPLPTPGEVVPWEEPGDATTEAERNKVWDGHIQERAEHASRNDAAQGAADEARHKAAFAKSGK